MKPSRNISFTFGINGSLRKREVQAQASYTEYYLFNSAANLKAYSYDGLDFAYYGYNASNTRAYKLSMLNQNQWVNGQPQPLNLQLQSAMFYPNAYINFNQNGEYTKHYYNGTERIASRLGDAQPESFVISSNDRLGFRIMQADQQARADLLELVEAGDVPIETPSVEITSLHPTNATSNIFYYHTNHLGSTAYVTDNNATITQGFLYAPFGEITTEYNANFGNNVLPKYSFNAKELDEETGMYYYEARYYKPPVFTSRDPMMNQKPWLSPYHYCSNNPVGKVDPSGMLDGWIQDEQGNVFWDNNTNSIEEFNRNYSGKDGYSYVSDADNPKSYTLPSGEGKLVMNTFNTRTSIVEGLGGLHINMKFIPTDNSSQIGWVQTYASNIIDVDSKSLKDALPENSVREMLDGTGVQQCSDPSRAKLFNGFSATLDDGPLRAKNKEDVSDVVFYAQSTVIINAQRCLSIGWGFTIISLTQQTIQTPTILFKTSNFHDSAVNNVLSKIRP